MLSKPGKYGLPFPGTRLSLKWLQHSQETVCEQKISWEVKILPTFTRKTKTKTPKVMIVLKGHRPSVLGIELWKSKYLTFVAQRESHRACTSRKNMLKMSTSWLFIIVVYFWILWAAWLLGLDLLLLGTFLLLQFCDRHYFSPRSQSIFAQFI